MLNVTEDWIKNTENWPANVRKRKQEQEAKQQEQNDEKSKQDNEPKQEHEWKREAGENKHHDAYPADSEDGERKDVDQQANGEEDKKKNKRVSTRSFARNTPLRR